MRSPGKPRPGRPVPILIAIVVMAIAYWLGLVPGDSFRVSDSDLRKSGATGETVPRDETFPWDAAPAQTESGDLPDGFLRELSTRELSGEWTQAAGQERVPGVGPIDILARVSALGYDPAISAKELMDSLRDLDRCDEGREKFYQASLIDVGTSEIVFMGVFFEEELLCEGFAPASLSF